jgi:hypothetical protein
MKKFLISFVSVFFLVNSFTAFAEGKTTPAQLDTTPPPADGALTPDQTPPFLLSTAPTAPIGKTAAADTDETDMQESLQ